MSGVYAPVGLAVSGAVRVLAESEYAGGDPVCGARPHSLPSQHSVQPGVRVFFLRVDKKDRNAEILHCAMYPRVGKNETQNFKTKNLSLGALVKKNFFLLFFFFLFFPFFLGFIQKV